MSYQKKHQASRMISRAIELITITTVQSGVDASIVQLMHIQKSGEARAILDELDTFIHSNELVNKREGELGGEQMTGMTMTPDPRPANSLDTVAIQAQLDTVTVQDFLKLLRKDADLRQSYHANIAMAFVDNTKWYRDKIKRKTQNLSKDDIHKIGNAAAKYFLDLLLGTGPFAPDQAAKSPEPKRQKRVAKSK